MTENGRALCFRHCKQALQTEDEQEVAPIFETGKEVPSWSDEVPHLQHPSARQQLHDIHGPSTRNWLVLRKI
jgi:hypothetical protein